MEKPRQLMIALGLLVTVSVLPTVLKEALPAATEGPVGFAWANSAAKHDATANEISLRFRLGRVCNVLLFITLPRRGSPVPRALWHGADTNAPSESHSRSQKWSPRLSLRL